MNLKQTLEHYNISGIKDIYHNLSYEDLYDHEINNGEVKLTALDAVSVDTGKFTGRSPKDKYIVQRDPSSKYIYWGDINQTISEALFDELFELSVKQLSNKNLYIQDAFCGASKNSQKAVRVVSEIAYHAHFTKNMFIRPTDEELKDFKPDFTVFNACKSTFKDYKKHGLNSEVFIVFDIERGISIIGGSWYTGEIKKGIFSIMNYLLPLDGKLPMHCSANVGKNGDSALFFGLSGTGKTTLSTDESRKLIGDDEHGWDDDGIFNFEGGCYAKCIGLNKDFEPEIYNAIKRDALLENVVLKENGDVDFDDDSKTENTRVSYPIYHIKNHEPSMMSTHPSNIIFLSMDAFGVLPPVSKLDSLQAMYYFLSGYTAKVAGTEIGIKEPVPAFSACFGEVFLPSHPKVYADLLHQKITKHNVNVYLVNTGYVGGGFESGHRISIKNTRACINAILDGSINQESFENMDIFNLQIPQHIKGVDEDILHPKHSWNDKEKYDETRIKLAKMFRKNFEKYGDSVELYRKHGPII